MRRSLGTHLSGHGTLKDAQGALRHASITTTGNVYVQVVEENVMRAVNSHASTGAGRLETGSGKHGSDGSEREASTEAICGVR
jgi:hypothetical protein